MQVLVFLALFGLATVNLSCDPESEITSLTILHTNDLHSHFKVRSGHSFGLGGYAKLATMISRLKQTNQEVGGETVVLDAGDYSEGSWYYSLGTGTNSLRLLDQMGFDAAVVGNHDYLMGPDRLIDTVREASVSFPVLMSNVDLSHFSRADEFREVIPGGVILEKGGLKIGVIGLSTVDYEYSAYVRPVVVTSPIEEAEAKAKALQGKVDVILVLSHNRIDVNQHIAKSTLGVHAVISGHSHKKLAQPILVDNAGRKVPVVETGEWGQFVGELKLKVHKSSGRVAFDRYELHPVIPETPEDPVVKEMIRLEDEKLVELAGEEIDRPVAQTEIALDHKDSHGANIGNLVTQAYRRATGADLALEAMPLLGVKVPAGPLSVRDLHDFMPHIYDFDSRREWTSKVWTTRGENIQKVMHAFYNLGHRLPLEKKGFLVADGLEVIWDPSASLNQLKKIEVQGEELKSSKTYRVAVTDGFLLALQIIDQHLHLGFDLSHVEDTGVEAWKAIVARGKELGTLTEENLRKGGRSFVAIPDPAVYHYGIDWEADQLEVLVSNNGLQRASNISLHCFHGKNNDLVFYDTSSEEEYQSIGQFQVPFLEAGESKKVAFSWSPKSGYWPIRCSLSADQDGYAGNSAAETLVLIQN